MAKKGSLQFQLDELREEFREKEQELEKAQEEMATLTQTAERRKGERETLKAENEKLRQAIVTLDEKLREATRPEEGVELLHQEITRLTGELEQSRTRQELEVLRAVEAREKNWLVREERLNRQLENLEAQLERERSRAEEEVQGLRIRLERERASEETPASHRTTDEDRERDETATGLGDDTLPSEITKEGTASVPVGLQQMPELPKFEGDKSGETETVEDWLDQLDIMAGVFSWREDAKLMHLVSRLKGAALAYYRTCPPETKRSYALLKEALLKRFTPVHVQAVQGALFYERSQKPTETVDQYAQELRLLFRKAFPKIERDSGEEGEKILTFRFVAGLRAEIKKKMVTTEGTFDQTLVRARFEEAQWRELKSGDRSDSTSNKRYPVNGGQNRQQTGGRPRGAPSGSSQAKSPPTRNGPLQESRGECYKCGAVGHYARSCPFGGRAQPKESVGKASNTDQLFLPRSTKVGETAATLKTLGTTEEEQKKYPRGKRISQTVRLDGQQIEALLDTGSPVTIVSLVTLLKCWKDGRLREEPDWIKEAQQLIVEPEVTVQDYGGMPVPILGEAEVEFRIESCCCRCRILVQEEAPQDLLLGTDVLGALGVRVTLTEEEAMVEEEEEHLRIKLLTSVRLPARHAGVVRAKCSHADTMLVLEAPKGSIDQGPLVETAVVMTDSRGEFNLGVTNYRWEPVKLEKESTLDCMSWQPKEITEQVPEADIQVNALEAKPCSVPYSKEREVALMKALGMDVSKLTLEQRDELTRLVLSYQDVFAMEDEELGVTSLVEHKIDTQGATPIKQYARRVPHAMRSKIKDLVAGMLEKGVIEPTHSPWASPVVLVAKKDGSTRFCVDYRKLNAVTKPDVFPLPRIDDCLDVLEGAKYFSTLDLNSGFWQVKMQESSAEKTAFTTHCGAFEFRVMPFGLINAPSTFQRLMERVLEGLTPVKCQVYIDDVLVVGATFEEHLVNLEAVFMRLREARLKLKPAKCRLIRSEVHYLGYQVSAGGISPDPTKLEAVKSYPAPTNVRKLRSFIGLASYYRRFVPNFAKIARPLHNLTKKDVKFLWTGECQSAFEQLREALIRAPVLAYPDFELPFTLETDASGCGLGAVLSQERDGVTRPVAYASRSLHGAEERYSATELEALGVVWAVKQFRHYLYGQQCEVITDHQPLRSLLKTPHPSGKLARWGLALQELDLTIRYRPGKQNKTADALSRAPLPFGLEPNSESHITDNAICALGAQSRRLPGEPDLAPSDSPEQNVEVTDDDSPGQCEGQVLEGTPGPPVGLSQTRAPGDEDALLASQQQQDEQVSPTYVYLAKGELPEDEREARRIVREAEQFTLVEEVLFRVQADKTLRLVVPAQRRKELFNEVHSGLYASHQRAAKIHSVLSCHYWWPRMRSDIESWCKACAICLERRAGRPKKPPMTPIPVGGPFDRVGIDILQMPKSGRQYQYVLVVIDYLTKWVEAYPLRDQTALTIAKTLAEKFLPVHGVPKELLSDRGANFLSRLMAEFYQLTGISKINTTAYHPQTDGLTERFNRTLLDMTAKSIQRASDWDLYLPFVLFSYRVA